MAAKSQSKVSGKSSKTPLSTNNTSKTDPKGKKSVTIADVRRESPVFFPSKFLQNCNRNDTTL